MVNKPNWCAYEIMLTNLFRTHFILSGQFLEFNVECYSQITSKKLESKYNMTRISTLVYQPGSSMPFFFCT